ncbi:hypothetical protein EB796_020824 [Bugula neritina]|uniref:PHD-type domain-containing protein n=1 Tax=Bugula neritina TaxID=10212 RepID=A0A7J7J3Y9_BUGNE|nr:hypothetical protein EB796_020824 [Bugula neritina]
MKNAPSWLAVEKKKKQKADFKWIECDLCAFWFHSTCQDLKVSEATAIVKLASKGVKWYCSGCQKTIQGQSPSIILQMSKLSCLQQMVEKLNGKVDEYQHHTTEQFQCLKTSLAETAKKTNWPKI